MHGPGGNFGLPHPVKGKLLRAQRDFFVVGLYKKMMENHTEIKINEYISEIFLLLITLQIFGLPHSLIIPVYHLPSETKISLPRILMRISVYSYGLPLKFRNLDE